MSNASITPPSDPRASVRLGILGGQDTPGANAVVANFAAQGLTTSRPPAMGVVAGFGYDVIRVPVGHDLNLNVATQIDLGISSQTANMQVPNMPDGYLYKNLRMAGILAPGVSVGLSHHLQNGLMVRGDCLISQNLLGDHGPTTGVRLEAGKRLSGFVAVNTVVGGQGAGDVTGTIGAAFRLK